MNLIVTYFHTKFYEKLIKLAKSNETVGFNFISKSLSILYFHNKKAADKIYGY